jgi:protein-disulfide isomerase
MRAAHTSSKLIAPVNRHDHIRGVAHPSVILVEYGDYECRHCVTAHGIVSELLSELHHQLGFVFRNFPLSHLHPHALRAAEAAEAAGAQGHFWEMHDLLFETGALEDEDLIGHADTLELNLDQFERDLRNQKYFPRVQEDFNKGVRNGVQGTPAFFINGIRHHGGNELSSLLSEILTTSR